ncbi:hypothetical protein ANN_21663 [Periplaneta americana]|uniref:Uncharacterized protein n=1 Tax=Periplaneta americana TaxID=6978 RepID=A0ABQ8S635_PERAM|nr:hypothetical protein ANN_21663 [Periplaneta americana]
MAGLCEGGNEPPCSLKAMLGQRYETLEDIRKAVRQCLREDESDFYSKGIFKLTEQREKYNDITDVVDSECALTVSSAAEEAGTAEFF